MTRPFLRRFGFEALHRELGAPSLHELEVLTGVCVRQWQRWAKAGIPDHEADRIALELGLQPELVWDDWTLSLLDDTDDQADDETVEAA